MSAMLLKMEKKTCSALMYNLNRHMFTGGGHSGELSEIIQNNAPVVSPYNYTLDFASQA